MLKVKPIIAALDIMPGAKTYSSFLLLVGMFVCQSLGYHAFSPESWGLAGGATGLFAKMGSERKEKE